jgi:BirA family transcriptional regulator, biotin operon repressor / biotin---[acetyl-CoA-carboxylase] ligase
VDTAHVRTLLTTSRIGATLVDLPTTGSTMDDVRARATVGASEGLVVSADEQTAGRGRFGRAWVAPAGVNLSLSILLRPSREQVKVLGMVAPLAVADAVAAVSGLAVQFKWPNDVRIGGRKLCGVLIESEFAGDRPVFAIAGIGLNVNLDTAGVPEIAEIATSIAREYGMPVSREQTLAALLSAFERWYDEPDPAMVWSAWRGRLETLGQEVEVTFSGKSERGVAEDVDAEGSLVLRRRDGARVILPAGEVTLRPGG